MPFLLDEKDPGLSELIDPFLAFLLSFGHSLSMGFFELQLTHFKLLDNLLIFLSLSFGLFINLMLMLFFDGLNSFPEPKLGLSKSDVEFMQFLDLLFLFSLIELFLLLVHINRLPDHFFEKLIFFLFLFTGKNGLLDSLLYHLPMFGLEELLLGFLELVDSGEDGYFRAVGFGFRLDVRKGGVCFGLHGR